MKPNFALRLSFDGIGLLHRTPSGWHLVGEVPLDAQDLAAELSVLASKARALDPTGLRCKLVLPPEQVKYLSFETATRDVAEIEELVRTALDGATPYSLDELSYDWSMEGNQVHVAAVARETLAEAEVFAVEHDFNPLCFVAMPEATEFTGEPFFGETAHAARMLGPDESIDRENEVIRIIGTARLPEPAAAGASETAADAMAAQAVTERAPPSDTLPKAASPPPEQPTAEPETGDPAAAGEAAAPAPPDGSPGDGPEDVAGDVAGDVPVDVAGDVADNAPEPSALLAFSSSRRRDGAQPAANEPPAGKAALPKARISLPGAPAPSSEKPGKAARAARKARKARAGKTAPAPEDATIPPPPAAASRAAAEGEVADTAPDFLAKSLLPDAEDAAPPPAETTSPDEGKVAFLSRRKAIAGARALGQSLGQSLGHHARRFGPRGAAAAVATPLPADLPAPVAPAMAGPELDEKARMTVFGARRTEPPRGGRSRQLALLLTGLVLLSLVGVGLWAALLRDQGVSGLSQRSAETRTIETEAPAPTAPAAGDIPDTQAPPESGESTVAADAAPDPDAAASEPDTAPRDIVIEELSPDEARARYAATGIWQVAPQPSSAPTETVLEDVYQTNLDPPLDFGDAVALPPAEALRPDPRPATPAVPPPPGIDYELDERGFVAATPEGTRTPEGIVVYAGRPPVIPPPTPPRAAPEALDGPEAAAPREPTVRPRLRPDDLTDLFERTSLGGRTRTELATIRPRLRPESAQASIEAAPPDATEADEGTDEQAVALSLRPRPRPEDLARQAALPRQQPRATEPASAAPRIPTTASVARAATEKDQISLRKVNLIGVYGSPENRRALVRLANGSYRKVQVGDRLDGGQVAAIGDNELRYVKNGRTVVLKLPKG